MRRLRQSGAWPVHGRQGTITTRRPALLTQFRAHAIAESESMEPERNPQDTPFFKAGAEARRAGIPLHKSALRALLPGCAEYNWFIAGYDSQPTSAGTTKQKEE